MTAEEAGTGVAAVDESGTDPGWTGGEWVALFGRRAGETTLRVTAEPGWPAPRCATSARHSLYLDGSAYLDDEGPHRLGASRVLEAYLKQGSGVLARLRGTFALLIWDRERDALVAARDPLGTHPLFHASRRDELAISPSLDALLRLTWVPATVDPLFLALRLIQLPGAPEETFFAAIRRIPAGHVLRADPSALRVSRVWDPLEGRRDAPTRRPEAARQFAEMLSTAVDRSLEGNRGAVFLSGGLDSAAVAAAAVDVSRRNGLTEPLALSFVSSDPAANEEATQRAIVDALGLPHLAMGVQDAVPDDTLLTTALALNRTKPGLLASPLHPIYDALTRRAVEAGCSVVLTGEGGDEWLLPRPEYLADRMLKLDVFGVWMLARAWYGYYPSFSKIDFFRGVLWKWGARRLLRATAGSALRRWMPAAFAGIRARRLFEDLPAWILPDAHLRDQLADRIVAVGTEPPARHLYRQSRLQLLDHPNVAEYCEESFSARRRLGVFVRAPFLDASLVEFLTGLSPSLLIAKGQAKWPARRLLMARDIEFANKWPRTVYGDRFFADVMRKEARAAWKAIEGAPLLSSLGVVDGQALDRAFERLNGMEQVFAAEQLWLVMSLETWLRARILQSGG